MRHRRKQAGFTLIELVASALLTSMMMTAILGIVWSTLKQTQQLQRGEARNSSPAALTRQLRMDLLNARGMQLAPDEMTLHGFLSRETTTGSMSLGVGRVRYALRNANGKRILARTVNDGRWEPLWIGFGSISIVPLAITESDEDSLPMAETGGLPEIPESFRVTVFNDDGTITWREVIHHHEN
jgi:Tfp pilus assembly protein PilV